MPGEGQPTSCTPQFIERAEKLLAGGHPVRGTVWQPRHGGGAHLVVGGVVVVEIEPMGPGWWVGAGAGDLVNGTLGEAKVRALEMLGGVDDRPDRPRHF